MLYIVIEIQKYIAFVRDDCAQNILSLSSGARIIKSIMTVIVVKVERQTPSEDLKVIINIRLRHTIKHTIKHTI